jgi:hypothetical protein
MAKVALAGVSKMQPSDLSQMEKSLYAPRLCDEFRHPLTHAITQWGLDPCLAGVANRIKLPLSFRSAQPFQL